MHSQSTGSKERHEVSLWETIVSAVAAVWIIGLSSYLLIRNQPFSDPNLVVICRTMLSLGVAALGATIPGFLQVGFSGYGWSIRAGGALALFVLTFFGSPKVLPSLQISGSLPTPSQYPPNTIIDSFPSDTELEAPPSRPPTGIVFSYKNDTGVDMKLYMYDFCKEHRQGPGSIFWVDFPFPANGLFVPFNRFEQTNGWIGFAVGWRNDSGAIEFEYLGTKNIFYSDAPTLSVTADGHSRRRWKPDFKER